VDKGGSEQKIYGVGLKQKKNVISLNQPSGKSAKMAANRIRTYARIMLRHTVKSIAGIFKRRTTLDHTTIADLC